jgi:hypothetical protein
MKILESYKKIAKSMLIEHAWDRKFGEPLPTLEDVMKEAEVDDEKMIKYKDKDGEQKQMKAGSAKTMDKDHPAKQAWDKLADKGGEEEPKGKGLEPDDFERDFDDSEPEDKEGGEEPSGEPKTFDDIKNHHSKAESAQDKVKDMIDKHNADHQMQDDDYEKWEDKSEALKAIENELQALTADDPNDSSYDGYKKGQKELTKQYISTLNKLSPAAKKILNKEEDKPKPSGDKTKKTGFVSKNKPQKAKDLANDPSVDTGPDSRGTSWSGDYYGAEDSAEWEDQYKEAEEDGDEEELAQIKWFGEKQGWGDNGEMPKGESIHPLKKMFNRIGG